MYWTKEEGYWCGRGDVKWCWVSWRCSFNWNWIFTQRGGHVHWWLKGWEVLALLDHHHFHLHLHLLHHHIHRRQCPLHCSGIQYLWIDKQTTKVVSLNVKMCHVLQRIYKIFTQMGPFIIFVNSVHRILDLYLVSSFLSHSAVWYDTFYVLFTHDILGHPVDCCKSLIQEL